jgi:hypothetical protein
MVVVMARFLHIYIIYAYWYPTRLPYQMMFVSFNTNASGVTRGAGTANHAGAPDITPGL